MLRAFMGMAEEVGVSLAAEKMEGPAMVFICWSIELDTKAIFPVFRHKATKPVQVGPHYWDGGQSFWQTCKWLVNHLNFIYRIVALGSSVMLWQI